MKIIFALATLLVLFSCAKGPVTSYDQYKPAPPPAPGAPTAPIPHVGTVMQ